MTSQYLVDIWACRQCGARLYQPYCMACNHRGKPCHDVRRTKLQGYPPHGISCLPSQTHCGVRIPMAIELVRMLPLVDQSRYLLACLKQRPPNLLPVGYDAFCDLCRAAGWCGIEPWTAMLWAIRRVCPNCQDNVVGLEQMVVGFAADKVEWLRIPRLKLCRFGCRKQEPELDFAGMAERLAEVKKRKQERGEM